MLPLVKLVVVPETTMSWITASLLQGGLNHNHQQLHVVYTPKQVVCNYVALSKNMPLYVILLCIYGVLRYLSSIATLTTSLDETSAPCTSPKTKLHTRKPTLRLYCTTPDWMSLMCMVMCCACLGPSHSPYSTHTTNVTKLTQQQQVTLLTSLAMTRFENRTHHIPDAERMRYWLCHGRGCRTLYKLPSPLPYQQFIYLWRLQK